MLIGEGGPFWWGNSIRAGLCWNAGFFPPTDEALNAYSNKFCEDIPQIDFDIAIIACGAYGMHVGAFIKRNLGKKAFHLCSPTQLLFGIKGRRWDTWPHYSEHFYNEHWVRPFASDTVQSAKTIEGGCCW